MSLFFNVDPLKFDKWKRKKHYICKTPGMKIFMALATMEIKVRKDGRLNGPVPKPRMFPKFPYEITDCRCRDCRYHRIFK
jgi:hypothetical protein